MELRNFFKKNNSKNSAQNEQDFYQKTPRKKYLKIFAAASLALITSATTLLATAPFGVGAAASAAATQNTTQTSTSNGLITPQEDDPVLFKTESGLDIKFGAATLTSGNLSGFPYFTTNVDAVDYTWVIIGTSNASLSGTATSTSAQFSTWKNFNGLLQQEFINNQFETNTPAGSAANNSINQDCLAYMNSIYISSVGAVVVNAEIPTNCVLVLANTITGTGVANTSVGGLHRSGSNYYYNYHSTYVGQLAQTLDAYYTNGSLGLLPIKDFIKPVSLVSSGRVGLTSDYAEWTWSSNTTTNYIFTLSANNNFKWSTYLTQTQAKLDVTWWLRDGVNSTSYSSGNAGDNKNYYTYPQKYYLNTSGVNSIANTNSGGGYRPAFCLSLV